jgi:hypothetical protein
MEKINLAEKFSLFSDHWNPKIVGELNGQLVKLVKLNTVNKENEKTVKEMKRL